MGGCKDTVQKRSCHFHSPVYTKEVYMLTRCTEQRDSCLARCISRKNHCKSLLVVIFDVFDPYTLLLLDRDTFYHNDSVSRDKA